MINVNSINLNRIIKNNKIIGIAGHLDPDGDCIGSSLGLYNYILTNFKNVDVRLYLEYYSDSYKFLKNIDKIKCKDEGIVFDIFFVLDCGSIERIGVARKSFEIAKQRIVIDHHKTNIGFGDINIILPEKSSTSEIVADIIYLNKYYNIKCDVAECLYFGIIHDTGLFSYMSTSYNTMKIAGKLMSSGINFHDIVQNTFFVKSYSEKRAVSYIVYNSKLYYNNKIVIGTMSIDEFKKNCFTKYDIDSAVSNLKDIKNVEIAIFIYELKRGEYKVSLRSKNSIDVSKIAIKYNGGGHSKASGFLINGNSMNEIINKILFNFKCLKNH